MFACRHGTTIVSTRACTKGLAQNAVAREQDSGVLGSSVRAPQDKIDHDFCANHKAAQSVPLGKAGLWPRGTLRTLPRPRIDLPRAHMWEAHGCCRIVYVGMQEEAKRSAFGDEVACLLCAKHAMGVLRGTGGIAVVLIHCTRHVREIYRRQTGLSCPNILWKSTVFSFRGYHLVVRSRQGAPYSSGSPPQGHTRRSQTATPVFLSIP